MGRTTTQIDAAVSTLEAIINGGNIVARSVLLEPASSQSIYLNGGYTIDSISVFNLGQIQTETVYSSPANFSLINCSLSGKNLYAIRINTATVLNDLVDMSQVSQTIIDGADVRFDSYLAIIQNTSSTIILDTGYSNPTSTEQISFLVTVSPEFDNYSSTQVGYVTALEVIRDNTDINTSDAFELLRANYVDSTIIINAVSQLTVNEINDVSGIVISNILNLADNLYVYSTNVILTFNRASVLITNDNQLSTSISDGNLALNSGTYDVRNYFPTTTANITDLYDSSYTITISSVTGITYYSSGLLISTTNDIANLNDNGSFVDSNFGGTQSDIDNNLLELYGSDNSRFLVVSVTDVLPTITGTELTVTDTTLYYDGSNFEGIYYQTYTTTVVRTTPDINQGVLSNATAYLVPYGTYDYSVNVSGIQNSFSYIPTNYSLVVVQQRGTSIHSNLVLVSSTAIYNDNTPTGDNNPINVTFTDVSFTQGVTLNTSTFLTDYPSVNAVKYSLNAAFNLIPVNNDTKVFYVSETTIIGTAANYSAVLVLDSPLDTRTDFGIYSPTVIGGVVQNISGTYLTELLVPSGLQGSGLSLIRTANQNLQSIGGTTVELELILNSTTSTPNERHTRFAVRTHYPNGSSDDYNILDYSGTSTNLNNTISDYKGVVQAESYLYIPYNVDNITGYYLRIASSTIDSLSVSDKSTILLPDNIREIVRVDLYDDLGIIAPSADNINEPNWDPNVLNTAYITPSAYFTYNLTLVDSGIVPSIHQDGIQNVIQLTSPANPYTYEVYGLDTDLTVNTVIGSGLIPTVSGTYVSLDSHLTFLFNSGSVVGSGDSIILYNFFNPIVHINANGEDTSDIFVTSTNQVVRSSFADDGAYLSTWDLNNLTVGSYNYYTEEALWELRNSTPTTISSSTAPTNVGGVFQYEFPNGANNFLVLTSPYTIGFITDTETVVYTNRTITTQVLDSSLVAVPGLETANYLLYDGQPLYVNLTGSPVVVPTSTSPTSPLIDIGYNLSTTGIGFLSSVPQDTFIIEFMPFTYTDGVNTFEITSDRTIDSSITSGNVVLDAIRFNSIHPETGTVSVVLYGDTMNETIDTTNNIISNADIINDHNTGLGFEYDVSQNFFFNNFSVTMVLLPAALHVELGPYHYQTQIVDNSPIVLSSTTGLTGLAVKHNYSSLYYLEYPNTYTQVMTADVFNAFKSNGSAMKIRQEGVDGATYTSGVRIRYNSTLAILGEQNNNGDQNLRFELNYRAGYKGIIDFPLFGGRFIMERYELPVDTNIQTTGSTTFIFKQESILFGDTNVVGQGGFTPDDINSTTNLNITFDANQNFFDDVNTASGMFILVDNDKAPLAIRKTGPNVASKYIVLVYNDVTNAYRVVTTDGLSVGAGGNYINLSGLEIGNLSI